MAQTVGVKETSRGRRASGLRVEGELSAPGAEAKNRLGSISIEHSRKKREKEIPEVRIVI